jgi:hypothetical protein
VFLINKIEISHKIKKKIILSYLLPLTLLPVSDLGPFVCVETTQSNEVNLHKKESQKDREREEFTSRTGVREI